MTRGERKEFTAMLEFAKAQNETIAIVADAVDRFQRSFKLGQPERRAGRAGSQEPGA